jgi:hypothetical protein
MRPLVYVLVIAASTAGCDKPSTTNAAGGSASEAPAVPRPLPPRDAAVPEARMLARHVTTFYRWRSTEPGNDTTRGESIEHGIPKLHLLIEVHRDASQQLSLKVAALTGDTAIPQSARMRSEGPTSATFNVPRDGFTKYSLEQFGGEMRNGEPVRVLLSTAPSTREALSQGSTPTYVRLPATGAITGGSAPQIGQIDAVLVFVIPVVSRRGGRYLVHAVDMNAEPGGFAANGVMARSPTDAELTRYVQWMRDRNGMGRDRNPPIALRPIDRS